MKNEDCFVKAINARKIQVNKPSSKLHLIMAQINTRIGNMSQKGLREGRFIIYQVRDWDLKQAIKLLRKSGYGLKTLDHSYYQYRWEFILNWNTDKKFTKKYRPSEIEHFKNLNGYYPKVIKKGYSFNIVYSNRKPWNAIKAKNQRAL